MKDLIFVFVSLLAAVVLADKTVWFEAEVGLDDEVLETNQDELGAQAARVAKGPRAEIWAKPMSDG